MKLHRLWFAALPFLLAFGCSDDRPSVRFTQDVPLASDMEDPPSDGPCALPNIMCGRRCVNPADDPNNCGGCGISCGVGRVCVNGRCDNQCPETPVRQTRCDNRCTDTNIDRMNCGACGTVCPEGQVCSGGTCQIECGPRYTSCMVTPSRDGGVGRSDATAGPSVRCADLRSDDQHCGACNNACPLGHACINGTCELRCPSGQTICGSRCADLMTSQSDCGTCGNACTGLQRCVNGRCMGMACPAGTMNCSGTCADLATSTAHCGMCGNACPAPQFCRGGRCVLECPTGRNACEGRCVDLQTDRTNCGMCGNACPPGQVCQMGTCRLVCPMGTIACMGRCVDPSSDRLNCGACGTTCGAGQLCNGGSCAPRCADTQTNCQGVCVNTMVDPNHCGACSVTCGPGYACSGGFCRPLVGTDVAGCAPPSVQCGPVCSDIRNDNEHCGRCGNRCTADRVCVQGACVAPCEPGQTRCGTACVNTLGDRNNCGRCGNVCPATLSCVAGACAMEPTFRIDELSTSMCRLVEHGTQSGDDRGGLAISNTRVFYTGDIATIHASLTDLSGIMPVMGTPTQHDGLVHDLASGEVYVLMNAAGVEITQTTAANFAITQLGVLNGTNGALTSTRIRLSQAIGVSSGASIFSGRGRMYLHTGVVSAPPAGAMSNAWYEIRLPAGTVTLLRSGVTTPTRMSCESWAVWGVAEFFDSERYAVYAESTSRIVRYRIRDGMISTVLMTGTAFPMTLADLCSFTVSPSNGRWYFHYEGQGFAGGMDESLAFCPARSSTP